jgi:hypothetical protein
MRLLLSPEPGDSGSVPNEAGKTAEQINHDQTGRVETDAGGPPAARVVATAEVTEEVLKLRAERDEACSRQKKAEIEAAHHADEARRLKDAGLRDQRQPENRSTLERWFDGEDV